MHAKETVRLLFTESPADIDSLLMREWLVTNGLGGYASGTLAGVPTRRYHSLLTANLTSPLGRHVMLDKVTELIRIPGGKKFRLGGKEWVKQGLEPHGARYLIEFRLESGIPIWRYQLGEIILEKWILMPHRQNTVHIGYRLVEGEGPIRIKLRLGVHFRPHDAPLDTRLPEKGYVFTASEGLYELHAPAMPALRLCLGGERGAFTVEGRRFTDIRYRVEESRGYESQGDLWSPGYFRVDLSSDREAALIASTEKWETILALDPDAAFAAELKRRQHLIDSAHPALRNGRTAQLVLAADQFIVTPVERAVELTRARAVGDEVRTVIAGYHWFTDWGRDTMISLEGLSLATGRHIDAGYILRTFGRYVRDGLIPNMFPEGSDGGVYHTADATLWFFHALDRYIEATGDRVTLRRFLPMLLDIIEKHLSGTRFGIGVDPADGLLRQGDARLPLTWMDARMGDWVVTPRRGKAVEINALWYNALCLLSRWLEEEEQLSLAAQMKENATRTRKSFNERFWNEETQHLFDIVDGEDGDDAACRPNQIFSVSLPNAALDQALWPPVVEAVRDRLLTPMGLRTLSADHPDYKPNYRGDLHSRDAAYHQGTVWPWLIGPFIDAWLKVHPEDRSRARGFLHALVNEQLQQACVGSVSEVFDAEPPFIAAGCIAQAWSVAEVLRCWVKTDEREWDELLAER